MVQRAEKIAEVWFKPDGNAFAVAFRIPQKSFRIPGLGQNFTIENLLKSVGIADDVDSWRYGDVAHAGTNRTNPEIKNPLLPPPQDAAHLEIYIGLKAPHAVAPNASPETPLATWQALEVRWKAVLSLEATVDTLRIQMEGILAEMESSLTKTLSMEEKTHALRADVPLYSRAAHCFEGGCLEKFTLHLSLT